MVGILLVSSWDSLCSGAMLVSGRVDFWCVAFFFVARCHIQVLQENLEASRRRPEAQGGPVVAVL